MNLFLPKPLLRTRLSRRCGRSPPSAASWCCRRRPAAGAAIAVVSLPQCRVRRGRLDGGVTAPGTASSVCAARPAQPATPARHRARHRRRLRRNASDTADVLRRQAAIGPSEIRRPDRNDRPAG
jgi:hypothetical protein